MSVFSFLANPLAIRQARCISRPPIVSVHHPGPLVAPSWLAVSSKSSVRRKFGRRRRPSQRVKLMLEYYCRSSSSGSGGKVDQKGLSKDEQGVVVV